jgi:hypothetical protein
LLTLLLLPLLLLLWCAVNLKPAFKVNTLAMAGSNPAASLSQTMHWNMHEAHLSFAVEDHSRSQVLVCESYPSKTACCQPGLQRSVQQLQELGCRHMMLHQLQLKQSLCHDGTSPASQVRVSRRCTACEQVSYNSST